MLSKEKLNLTMLCDFYELTMGYGFYRNQKHEEEVVFDLFFRKNSLIQNDNTQHYLFF